MLKSRLSILIVFLAMIFFPLLQGCKPKVSAYQHEAFTLLFPDVSMDEYLQLTHWKTEEITPYFKQVNLLVDNISTQPVRFEVDMGVKLLIYSEPENKWIEIANKVNYLGEKPRFLAPKGEILSRRIFVVAPDMGNNDKLGLLRIVVIGEIISIDQKSNKTVGAYIDIPLD